MGQVHKVIQVNQQCDSDGEVVIVNAVPAAWSHATGVAVTPGLGGGMSPQAQVTEGGPFGNALVNVTIRSFRRDAEGNVVPCEAGTTVRHTLVLYGQEN